MAPPHAVLLPEGAVRPRAERGGEATAPRSPFSRTQRAPAGVESIDFDLHESEQVLSEAAAPAGSRRRLAVLAARWCLVALVGLCTGLTASLIDALILKLVSVRYSALRALLHAGASPTAVILVHVFLCTGFAAVAAALVCFVEPLAAGSGIPEVKCRLNGVDLPNVVEPRTYVAKALGVLFSVAAHLPCGKEGPMIHSGAVLGALASRLGARFGPRQWNAVIEERDFIAAGAAAGVAGAFGAPLGGILFALEEGASFWSAEVLLRAFLCASVSALTLNFLLVGSSGVLSWGSLGSLGVLTFGSSLEDDNTSYRIWELPIFVAMGCVGGLLGALFNWLNTRLTLWRMRHVGPRGRRRFLEALLVTAAAAAAFFAVPLWTHSCFVPSVDSHRDCSWISCEPPGRGSGVTSAVGLFIAPGEDSIKALLHDHVAFDCGLLAGLAALYFCLACWTYGLGVPSGLFVPGLLLGSVLGRLWGQFLHDALGFSVILPGSYALIGAAASLAGTARITISLAVILVEATGNTQWSLPVLFTVLAARCVGDLFTEGIYDIHIGLKNVPLLPEAPDEDHRRLRVGDAMARQPVVLEQRVLVRHLVAVLEQTPHNGFPVVEPGTGRLLGLAQRGLLQMLLWRGSACGAFREPGAAATAPAGRVPCGAPAVGWPPLDEALRALTPADLRLELDLGPYMDGWAPAVQEGATLRRAYTLFRGLGLRHLPVVRRDGCVLGVITRKDLLLAPHGT
uniref:Chloride channel protein n=1 Tax=Alexandrium monilatum TaxID=311494 RepID=A0A7S4QMQ0_9DINO